MPYFFSFLQIHFALSAVIGMAKLIKIVGQWKSAIGSNKFRDVIFLNASLLYIVFFLPIISSTLSLHINEIIKEFEVTLRRFWKDFKDDVSR